MLKRELVWRQLADDVLTARRTSFHQTELSSELHMSMGNVNLALEPLKAIGAVDVVGKNLIVRDVKKILMLWAARRATPQVIAAFEAMDPPNKLLKLLPPGLSLTSFAGYTEHYHDQPAPLSVIRAYMASNELSAADELARRFTVTKSLDRAAIVVYAADDILAQQQPSVVGPAQMYIDIWNEGDFFASDYLRALEGRLGL